MKTIELLLVICLVSFSIQKLVLVQSIFRHGARETLNPEFLVPAGTPHPGELTTVGMRQHFNLGQYMRQKYIEQHKLLSDHYNPNELYVRATDVNRTIVSVLSQLQGLYPNGTGPEVQYQVNPEFLKPPVKNITDYLNNRKEALPNHLQIIPVHVFPIQLDQLLKAYDFRSCKVSQRYYEEQKQTQKDKEMEQNMTDVYEWVSTTFNHTFTDQDKNLLTLEYCFDNKHVNLYQGKQWYLDSSSDLYKKMKYNFYFSQYYEMYGTQQQLKLYNSNLFERLFQNMQSRIDGTQTERLYLYSAHDTTVIHVMMAFNLTSYQCEEEKYYKGTTDKRCYDFPGYASSFQIELHQNDTDINQYYVQVIFDGQPIHVDACSSQYCSLQQFQQIQKSLYLSNFMDVCNDVQPKSDDNTAVIVLTIITGLLFIIVMILIHLFRKAVRQRDDYQKISNQI